MAASMPPARCKLPLPPARFSSPSFPAGRTIPNSLPIGKQGFRLNRFSRRKALQPMKIVLFDLGNTLIDDNEHLIEGAIEMLGKVHQLSDFDGMAIELGLISDYFRHQLRKSPGNFISGTMRFFSGLD